MIVLRVGRNRGETHYVYTVDEARQRGIRPVLDWRAAERGDWIVTREGGIMQVIDAKSIASGRYIRTATGSFHTTGRREPTQEMQKDRFSFGGRGSRVCLSPRAKLFIREYLVRGDLEAAYRAVYPKATSAWYVERRVKMLMANEKVQEFYVSEVTKAAEEAGFSLVAMMKEARTLLDNAKDPKFKLQVLKFVKDTILEAESLEKSRFPGGRPGPGLAPGKMASPALLSGESSNGDMIQVEGADAEAFADHMHRRSRAIPTDAELGVQLPEEVAGIADKEARIGAGIEVDEPGRTIGGAGN